MIRLKTPVFISLDVLLLIFGLYHALYGLYAVFLDFDSGKKQRVVVLGLLVVMGLSFAGFGIFGLFNAVSSP
jgi:succinate dehydrogenase / fumarate reductase membrane anchor subunit